LSVWPARWIFDSLGRQRRHVLLGPEAVIGRAHVDVVDVEQDAAVGPLGELGEELPLGHDRVRKGEVARDVLDEDLPVQPLLHGAHARDDVRQRLLGERQRKQVVRIVAADAAPAKMVRNPRRLEAPRQGRELPQIGLVQRVGRAERQRRAVEDRGGHRARARSRTASGRPPRIMKFSEIASNQSTRAVPSSTRG